ncbi:MAG: hypothetical protein ACLQGP_22570 [Isosphaeraceae bacterium]
MLSYKFLLPHPDKPEFPEKYTAKGEAFIEAAGLKVIPNGDGTVKLIQIDPETGSWENVEDLGDRPVKEVGYFYIPEDGRQHDQRNHIPVDEFPKCPEDTADTSDYVTFEEAINGADLTRDELSKACSEGRVRYIGKYKGRLVHGADVIRVKASKRKRRDKSRK